MRNRFRLDRRDSFLCSFGLAYAAIGYSYIGVSVSTEQPRTALSWMLDLAPLWLFGVLWLAAGLTAIVAGLTRHPVAGFRAVAAMPALWGLTYVVGWLQGDAARGWVSAILFAMLARTIQSAAGMVDARSVSGGVNR